MNPKITCVRCATTVARPENRRTRCAVCGTALPLFEDDPAFPVPDLPNLPPPEPPRPSATTESPGGSVLPSAGGWDDFKLETTDEILVPAEAAAVERPAIAARLQPPPSPPVERPRVREPRFGTGRRRPILAPLLVALLVAGGASFLVLRGTAATAPAISPAIAPPSAPSEASTRPMVADTVEVAPPPPQAESSEPSSRPAAEPTPVAGHQRLEAGPRPPRAPVREVRLAGFRPQVEPRPLLPGRVAAPASGPPPLPPPDEPKAPAGASRAADAIPLPPPPDGMHRVVDAPVYPGEGFKKPRPAEPSCIRDALRLPRDLSLSQDEVVTVRFAVGPDGLPTAFSVLGAPSDSRLAAIIWSAVQRCRFVPGSDARGNPALVWLVMPFRFAAM